ncbi:MAG: glycerophosphodiester phosphodiesterase family protein [Novosphingobium sp.]
MLAVPVQAQIIIAHRGASGERPEHTLAAYELAIEQGADYIEPDLVPTKDGVLVARHENEISGTTDIALRPEFASRKATKTIDGKEVTGWFTEDFTLAELLTLRARERLPEVRPQNVKFDGLYPVPTFAEVAALAKAKKVGIYPELKHPAYFSSIGMDTPDLLLAALRQEGLDGADAQVFIQCFEVGPLKRMRALTPLKLVQLIAAGGGPADVPGKRYADMMSDAGLRDVATYADAVGIDMALLGDDPNQAAATVARAKAAGLAVHVWTLRRENRFLPVAFRRGSDPDAPGDFAGAWRVMSFVGVDGVFTDNPGEVP